MSELDFPKLPPEALELLQEPRLEGMAKELPGFPPEERLLTPADSPAPGESPHFHRTDPATGRRDKVFVATHLQASKTLRNMRDRLAAAIAIAFLSLMSSACGDHTAGAEAKEEMRDQPLSTAQRAKLDACLAQAVTSPWRLVRTQAFVKNLSVTIEARSDDLELPHRQNQMRHQQYVEIGIGRGSHWIIPSAELLQSQISQGLLAPRAEVAGLPAAAFEPFVPYALVDLTLFLNIPGDEQCEYRASYADWPNPFVECKARRGEYTVGVRFPHDAIAHLPRVFAVARPLIHQVTSCHDQTKET